MKAIILAAGMGTRIRPLTDKMPKAFIEIDGVSLIKRSLDNLEKVGIREVIIVIGYKGSYFKERMGNRYKNLNITYVINPEYQETGSMFSLSQIEGLIHEDILLLESDLLYELKALTTLINSNELNVILTAPLSGSGDEVFICVNENNELVNLGKRIKESNNAIGELVGITKLSLDFLAKLFNKAKEDYRQNEKNYHYEEVIFKLSKTYQIKCILSELAWIEIDNFDDLKRAKEVIYPRIKNIINK